MIDNSGKLSSDLHTHTKLIRGKVNLNVSWTLHKPALSTNAGCSDFAISNNLIRRPLVENRRVQKQEQLCHMSFAAHVVLSNLHRDLPYI